MTKLMSIEEIVALLREQARMRFPQNDVRGILLHYAYKIETDVDALEHPTPFSGLDACETE
jgi:hypothetical protein